MMMNPPPSARPGRTPGLAVAAMAVAWLLAGPSPSPAAALPQDDELIARGAQIYRNQCAECHGDDGEGTELDYPHPLEGNKSVEGLTGYVDEKMPPGFEEEVVGEDAEAVARYVYDAFYSEIARARNAPARIELARLTVPQYRNAVSDLVGSFRPRVGWGGERGLKGEYYSGRRTRKDDRVIERVDPEVDFDFGPNTPDPEDERFDKPNEFSIRWEGSLLPADSGTYTIIVRTEHAIRLWLNDDRQAVIDGYVQSGDMTEHRAQVELLAGRPYRLRVEFSKANQGVKKEDEEQPEIPASIVLGWAPPRRAEEVIPGRHLSPEWAPEVFVLTTPFPPDDRSIGYERGTTVSASWESATTEAAIEVAAYVVEHLDELAGIKRDDPDRDARLRDFASTFVERAFRRPLGDEQRDLYVSRHFDDAPDAETAIKRVVLLALKSPRFLYHEINEEPDAYDVASRISFALWDSLPDEPLLKAAAEGKLSTPEQVEEQARRMIADQRTRAKLLDFFHRWLKVEEVPDLAKSPDHFAEFDEEVISDLRTSLDLFLEDVAWNDESSDFRRLLLDRDLYLNGRLAEFYGADLPVDSKTFDRVAEGMGERAGVLSHPYLLANLSYTQESSPIHRGVFLARGVLGQRLRPPPVAVSPLAPDLHADLTTRERVALQTSPESCMSCHAMINPLGFALENFDAVGRFRLEDKGRPVDASGLYQTRTGETVPFEGVRALAEFLADSEEVHGAFVEQVFQHLVKQPVRAYGPDTLAELREDFAGNGYNIRDLLVEIVARTALVPRERPSLASASE
jgi:mono/diheme cytochrome c family protein